MNRTCLFAFSLVFCFFTPSADAQNGVLKATPFQPIIGKFSVAYEYAFSKHFTLQPEYQLWFEKRYDPGNFQIINVFPDLLVKNYGNRAYVFFRFYPKSALRGGFAEMGGYGGFHHVITEHRTPDNQKEVYTSSLLVYGLRLGGGWQFEWKPVRIEFSGGLSLNGNTSKMTEPATMGMKPFSPYSRMAVGFRL